MEEVKNVQKQILELKLKQAALQTQPKAEDDVVEIVEPCDDTPNPASVPANVAKPDSGSAPASTSVLGSRSIAASTQGTTSRSAPQTAEDSIVRLNYCRQRQCFSENTRTSLGTGCFCAIRDGT